MCTLIIARPLSSGPDLYVIGNRDEMLDRPAQGPVVHRRNSMRILAPRDVEAGGTWIGLNEAGVFAGITNRFGTSKMDHHRSRGHVVFQALEEATAGAACAVIEGLSAGDYAGFHLAVADRESGWVLWNDGSTIRKMELRKGFYVLSERSFGAAPSKRLKRLSAGLQGLRSWSEGLRHCFRRWMQDHDERYPLEGVCIHAEARNYGTRSSSIVELGDKWRFAHAHGPPCSTTYEEHLQMLKGEGN